jgi:TonB family protein
LLRLVIGGAAVRRMAKRAAPPADGDWSSLVREISDTLRLARPVRLLLGGDMSPMTWGVFRHTILLPSTGAEWPDERRRMVLAHELAHVKRNDGLIQTVVQVACSVYWFNPLVWYAAHRVRVERELACDDQVLGIGTTAEDYAEHLIQIVRGLRGRRALSLAAVSMAQPSQLETRLVSLLDSRARRRKMSKLGVIALCLLACAATAALAALGVATAVPMPPVLVSATMPAPPAPEPEPAPKPASLPQRTRIGNGNSIPNNAVVPPQVLESSLPEYTNEAVLANVEGVVTLEASVDAEGKVTVLRVIKGLGHGLDQNAINAVLSWKFKPALRGGAPVAAITQIEVDFKIPVWYRPALKDEEAPIRVGPGVTPPTVISRVEPHYTDEARAAKYRGTLVVTATVHKDGTLSVDKVVRELEYGLTEKGIEALEQWKFKPALRNGEAVPVSLNIEVNFNLK